MGEGRSLGPWKTGSWLDELRDLLLGIDITSAQVLRAANSKADALGKGSISRDVLLID